MRILKCSPIRLICLSLALVALSACGDEPLETPEFSDLGIVCEQSASGDEGLVVKRVQVHVSNPNRDLVSVQGTVNAVMVTLTDPDADLVFTWSPPEEGQPMDCKGDFVVSLEAVDANGNSTQFYEIMSK